MGHPSCHNKSHPKRKQKPSPYPSPATCPFLCLPLQENALTWVAYTHDSILPLPILSWTRSKSAIYLYYSKTKTKKNKKQKKTHSLQGHWSLCNKSESWQEQMIHSNWVIWGDFHQRTLWRCGEGIRKPKAIAQYPRPRAMECFKGQEQGVVTGAQARVVRRGPPDRSCNLLWMMAKVQGGSL